MAAASNITLTDQEALARVFNPMRQLDDGFEYLNRASGLAVGQDKLVLRVVRPRGAGGVVRNIKPYVRLETPILRETSTGSTSSGYTAGPEVDYRLVAELNVTCPVACSLQERKNLHTMFMNFMTSGVIHSLIDDYEHPF